MSILEKILLLLACILLITCIYYCEGKEQVIINLKPANMTSDHNASELPADNHY